MSAGAPITNPPGRSVDGIPTALGGKETWQLRRRANPTPTLSQSRLMRAQLGATSLSADLGRKLSALLPSSDQIQKFIGQKLKQLPCFVRTSILESIPLREYLTIVHKISLERALLGEGGRDRLMND